MSNQLHNALDWIHEVEGLRSNHKADRGGDTFMGITSLTASRYGYTVDDLVANPELVDEIYYDGYWLPAKCHHIAKLSTLIAPEVFDVAVNCGPARAQKLFQKAINCLNPRSMRLEVDGRVGPATMRAFTQLVPTYEQALANAINGEQYLFYRNTKDADPSQEAFIKGWVGKRTTPYYHWLSQRT